MVWRIRLAADSDRYGMGKSSCQHLLFPLCIL